MDIFRSKKMTKLLPLLTARFTILCTRRLQPPRDDCAVPRTVVLKRDLVSARERDFVACEQQRRRSACASAQSDQRL